MAEQITVHSGETFEKVLVNESVDLHITQEAGSHVRLHVVDLAGCDSHIRIDQTGTGCETEIYGLCYLSTSSSSSLHTHVRHLVGGGKSTQLVKFALGGESKGAFFGELYIAPDAQQTEALQTNRNLLLSDKAEMRTRPQLEIYADDVKASHGASTGQLDESSLFYMQQRGISPEVGRQLLIEAFLNEIIDTIQDEKLVESLHSMLQHE